MEASDSPNSRTARPGSSPPSGDEIRRATFPQALRGYDRQAVHDLLDRVADWMEGQSGAVTTATGGMQEELAKVGERTAGILTAAEEAARNIRDEAAEYAERLRADAEGESRKARLNASQRMDEMIAEAEEKAQRIIDDAVARRRQLNQAISSLIDRRDEIAADAARLADELMAAVESLRSSDQGFTEDDSDPGGVDTEFHAGPPDLEEAESDLAEPEEAEPEEPDSEEAAPDPDATQLHEADFDEEELEEPEGGETEGPPTLLVDPDAEDDTPPYRRAR